MALLHEEEEDHNYKDKRSAEERYSLEPQKAHPTGKFIIVAKFGGHVVSHLASRLTNVIRQRDREKGRLSDKKCVLKLL